MIDQLGGFAGNNHALTIFDHGHGTAFHLQAVRHSEEDFRFRRVAAGAKVGHGFLSVEWRMCQ